MLENFSSSRTTSQRLFDGISHSNKIIRLAGRGATGSQFDFDTKLPFYGKVDNRMNPVQPNKDFLVSIGTSGGGNKIQVFDFVASAFDSFL